MKYVIRFMAAALAVIGAGAPAVAQDAAERQRLDDIARTAAQQFAAARAETDQTRPSVTPAPGTSVELTLDAAIARALDRNLDLAVERLNPQTFDFTIAALEASYRPTFNTTFGKRDQSSFARSQTTGATNQLGLLSTDTLTSNSSVSQALRWGGGSVAVGWNNSRQEQSDLFATRNPSINTNLTATFVQPLLRNFRTDGTRAQLQTTRLSQQISETNLRASMVRVEASVRNAYWDLVFAIQALEVADRSLALATKLVEDNQARVEVGTLAPLDVVQAQAEQANRRQAVATATATRRTAELALKRLLVEGTDDPLWTASIEPVDRPTYATTEVDVAGAVRRALTNRTDLETARRQLQSNDINLATLSDQRLPSLDLTASYGLAGIGGPQFVRQGLGGQVAQVIPSGFGDALGLLADRRAPTWNFSLNLSYPIGTSAADANLARARLQQRQTIAQSRALELQIATEVTNAALQVESNRERWQAATVALALAERRLDAEQSRFDVGLSTNFFVVQAQRDLRDAQNSELRALLDYRRALVEYERVQQIPAGGGGGNITNIQGGGGQAPRANAGGGGGFGN